MVSAANAIGNKSARQIAGLTHKAAAKLVGKWIKIEMDLKTDSILR